MLTALRQVQRRLCDAPCQLLRSQLSTTLLFLKECDKNCKRIINIVRSDCFRNISQGVYSLEVWVAFEMWAHMLITSRIFLQKARAEGCSLAFP